MSQIVLLEDDELVRLTIADALRDAGLDVCEAATAEEAVAALGDDVGIRVLVTDLNLGSGRTGLEVAFDAHEAYPRLAVIYITGRPDLFAGYSLRDDEALLPKPFRPASLLGLVNDMLARTSAYA